MAVQVLISNFGLRNFSGWKASKGLLKSAKARSIVPLRVPTFQQNFVPIIPAKMRMLLMQVERKVVSHSRLVAGQLRPRKSVSCLQPPNKVSTTTFTLVRCLSKC